MLYTRLAQSVRLCEVSDRTLHSLETLIFLQSLHFPSSLYISEAQYISPQLAVNRDEGRLIAAVRALWLAARCSRVEKRVKKNRKSKYALRSQKFKSCKP